MKTITINLSDEKKMSILVKPETSSALMYMASREGRTLNNQLLKIIKDACSDFMRDDMTWHEAWKALLDRECRTGHAQVKFLVKEAYATYFT